MPSAPNPVRVARAFLGGGVDERQAVVVLDRLGEVLAILRAQYISYQHSHWQVEGGLFYADHLLFQRLYESVQTQVDELAEKIIGYAGSGSLDAAKQAASIAVWVARWSSLGDHHARGVLSEEDLQRSIQAAYDDLKAIGAMTLGLDDWLMSTASAHESNAYLLQQVLAGHP
jgi:DNA-binding ferritin-like protein